VGFPEALRRAEAGGGVAFETEVSYRQLSRLFEL
jgi:hypothetical protein